MRFLSVLLAAAASGQVHPDAAPVLANRDPPSIIDGSWKIPAVQTL
jgi:hypothetical protein